jgi:tetrahydromethanopterin S-methyltransferase subunit A
LAFFDNLKALFGRDESASSGTKKWPFISGPYYVVDETAPVIVVMPNNDVLASTLAALSVKGLCMISSSCRSASDVEKLTRNVEANLAVQCILLVGGESGKEYPAVEALCAIFDNDEGISEKARQIAHGARGKLKAFDFAALQKRVRVINTLECVEVDKVIAGIVKHGTEGLRPDAGFLVQGHDTTLGVQRVIAPTDISHEYQPDKAGKYNIGIDDKSIIVEHYNSKGELLRLI